MCDVFSPLISKLAHLSITSQALLRIYAEMQSIGEIFARMIKIIRIDSSSLTSSNPIRRVGILWSRGTLTGSVPESKMADWSRGTLTGSVPEAKMADWLRGTLPGSIPEAKMADWSRGTLPGSVREAKMADCDREIRSQVTYRKPRCFEV